jgi:hypothetical protein
MTCPLVDGRQLTIQRRFDRHTNASSDLVVRFVGTGKVFPEFAESCFRVRVSHAVLSVVLTVIWQNGNVVRNTFHPSVVNGVLRMRVSDFEFQPVSRIEKHLVVKFVTVGINAGDDVVIIFLELVGHAKPSAEVAALLLLVGPDAFAVQRLSKKLTRVNHHSDDGRRSSSALRQTESSRWLILLARRHLAGSKHQHRPMGLHWASARPRSRAVKADRAVMGFEAYSNSWSSQNGLRA